MFETEGVTDFVNDFLSDSVIEHFAARFGGQSSIGGRLETVGRDDASVAVQVGETEDVVTTAIKQIFRGDCDVFSTRTDVACEFDELLGTVLVPTRIVCSVRNRLFLVDRDITPIDGADARRSLTLYRSGDITDRHDVDMHRKGLERTGYKYPDVTTSGTREALIDRLARYESLIEVGIGNRTDIAQALAHRASVTATDIRDCSVPDSVTFVRDDITSPDSSVYAGGDAIYALNCPPELQEPLWTVARRYEADCLFTTLGADPALLRVERETLPGETLFRVRVRPNRDTERDRGTTP